MATKGQDKSTMDPFADMNKMLEAFKLPAMADFGKTFEQLRVPGLDLGAMAASSRKDFEALIEANRVAYEGMQALARKQAEVMSQAVQGIQSAAAGAAGNMQSADGAKMAEMARDAYRKALTDMTELAQIAAKAQAEAVASLTKRASEHVQELQQMMAPPKK